MGQCQDNFDEVIRDRENARGIGSAGDENASNGVARSIIGADNDGGNGDQQEWDVERPNIHLCRDRKEEERK